MGYTCMWLCNVKMRSLTCHFPIISTKRFGVRAVYKLSGSPGILTPKIAGGLPDFSTWASGRLPCFTPICTSIYGMDAHRCWRTPRFIDTEIRRMPMFFFLIYTLGESISFLLSVPEFNIQMWYHGIDQFKQNISYLSITSFILYSRPLTWSSQTPP